MCQHLQGAGPALPRVTHPKAAHARRVYRKRIRAQEAGRRARPWCLGLRPGFTSADLPEGINSARILPQQKPMLTNTCGWYKPGQVPALGPTRVWYAPTTSPLNNFKPFFTLFSKFFPSFLHSTCSLSVSRQYLALDEVYHPIRPAFPSKPTLWRELATRGRPSQRRGSNPLWHPVPGTDLYPAPHESAPIDYNSEDSQLELFPVHSPLLGESWLVSFPPLSNMLKFGG